MGDTGANSGIGEATSKVLACASEKFHVIMACRSLEKANSALSDIEATGIKGSLSALQLDVTDEKSIEEAAKVVQQKYGRLDVLVNNAAIGNRDENIKTRLQLNLETNVIGPAMVSEAFRPLLFKSQKPYSIYVSSGAGSLAMAADPTSMINKFPSFPRGEAYRLSKTALNMLAILESNEFKSTPLKVFAMCPGFVRSNLRGTSEEERSGWGMAGDPENSGKIILRIIQGERDADAGEYVHQHEGEAGVYPW